MQGWEQGEEQEWGQRQRQRQVQGWACLGVAVRGGACEGCGDGAVHLHAYCLEWEWPVVVRCRFVDVAGVRGGWVHTAATAPRQSCTSPSPSPHSATQSGTHFNSTCTG